MSDNYYQDQHYNPTSYSPQVNHENTNPSPFLKANPYGNDLVFASHSNSPGNISINQIPYIMSPVTRQFEYSPQDQAVYSDHTSLQLTPPAMVQSNYSSHILEQINGQTEYSQNIDYSSRVSAYTDSNSGVTPAQLLELTFREDNRTTYTPPVQESKQLIFTSTK